MGDGEEGVTGGCHCGAIRYTATGAPIHASICYCSDCRRSAGAVGVGWALFPNAAVTITGTPADYASSPGTLRQFCGACGTGLFYRNAAIFPDQVDIQSGTLDDPARLAPQARIQLADAPAWAAHVAELPGFDRFPG